MATIAVGDIHGYLGPLRDLLARLRAEVTQDDTVITAYYVMERQSNGTWKIAACTLEASAARSV